ncbi:MAG: hypothetical protein LBG57_01945 [Treponema sp.]|jgi:hypothetical protein|nr:hypothetical protein [Treponema sp.]
MNTDYIPKPGETFLYRAALETALRAYINTSLACKPAGAGRANMNIYCLWRENGKDEKGPLRYTVS